MRGISTVSSDTVDASTASEQFYDAQESLSSSVPGGGGIGGGNDSDSATPLHSLSHLDSAATGVGDEDILGRSAAAVTMGDIDAAFASVSAALSEEEEAANALRTSLDVFDQSRVQVVNLALERVAALLQRLDGAEQYYASGKMFRIDHPVVGSAEFHTRVKCLCMWFNLTKQLRDKINVLGNVLLGLGAARGVVPWPNWSQGDSVRSQMSDESGILSPMSSSSMGNIQAAAAESAAAAAGAAASTSPICPPSSAGGGSNACGKVRFRLEEGEISSTNPSDSNNSTSTDSGAHGSSNVAAGGGATSAAAAVAGSVVAVPGTGRQLSTISVGSSHGSSSMLGQVRIIPDLSQALAFIF